MAAWDAYICSLPARVGEEGELRPADWAFGAQPPSPGKQLAHHALQLYLSSTRTHQPYRHVLPPAFLREWRWRPPGSSCPAAAAASAATDEAWLRADVCAAHATNSAAAAAAALGADRFKQVHSVARLLDVARGNASGGWSHSADPLWMATSGGGRTSAGLWIAAQLIRRVRHAIGPCTRPLVESLLSEASGRMRAAAAAETGAPRLAIGVQVRRGDACERWAEQAEETEGSGSRGGRPCFRAVAYVRAARYLVAALGEREMARSGIRRRRRETAVRSPSRPPWLLVATDSPVVISELRAAIRPGEFEVLHTGGPRGAGWGGATEKSNGGQTKDDFIEARNDRGLVQRAPLVASLFADLELLSRADAFVGTASSWTSRVALLAIMGERGVLPPFVMVDRPLRQLWFA